MMNKPRIDFESDGVEMPALSYPLLREWIEKVAAAHGRRVRRLLYLFMDDERMLHANREYLGHDYYTDIITFDYCHDNVLSGEMLISLDTIASNARQLGVPYQRELLRVVIHGVLHLCGIDDKGPGEREIMETNEDSALILYDECAEECASNNKESQK